MKLSFLNRKTKSFTLLKINWYLQYFFVYDFSKQKQIKRFFLSWAISKPSLKCF